MDAEGRFIALVFADAIVVNSYVPTLSLELLGKQRNTDFWKAAVSRCKRLKNKFQNRPVMWMGDMNVAPY